MILGGLETLCLGVVFLFLLVVAAFVNLALLGQPREISARYLTQNDTPPVTLNTAFQLDYYFPLPPGFAYTDLEDGTPIIVRIDDQLPLNYRLTGALLTFEEPYVRPDGTTGQRQYRISRQPNYSLSEAIGIYAT